MLETVAAQIYYRTHSDLQHFPLLKGLYILKCIDDPAVT